MDTLQHLMTGLVAAMGWQILFSRSSAAYSAH